MICLIRYLSLFTKLDMFIPNAADPSFRQLSVFSVDTAILILRSHPEVAKYGNVEGYVYIPTFTEIFEKVTNVKMIPELLDVIKLDKRLMINAKCADYIHASCGHFGAVLSYMLGRTHTPYQGPRHLFAFTHTSMDGLGVINSGRTVNMLIAPEFLMNKGVKAYVDIRKLAENGIQVWKQNGDMHTARVFCFSPDIRNFVHKYDFSSEYLKEDNLFRTHYKLVETFKFFYPHLDNESFEKKVKEKLKKLIVIDESDEDDDAMCTDMDDSIESQMDKLAI